MIGSFSKNVGKIKTEDSWVLSVIRKGYKILFYKETISFPDSCFSQADQKSSTGERGYRTSTQRGSGENKPGRSRILISNFLGSQENQEIKTYDRSVQTEFRLSQMETANEVRQSILPNDWAFSLDLTDAYRISSQGLIINNEKSRFNSCQELCFYRDGISDSQEHSSSAMGQSTRHSESCTLVQNE